MAEFHFVDDYVRLVAALKAQHPIDEAMSLAVGGGYEQFGAIEADILEHYGLRDGEGVLDFGCGSGRLAHALGKRRPISYLGIDIVQDLLDYAATKAPAHYRFRLSRALTLPVVDGVADWCCAFSVFTHLLHAESFLYLEELKRIAKPGGRILVSFLEFGCADHWPVFAATVEGQRQSALPHLNMFIERDVIRLWAGKLGLEVVEIVDGNEPRWKGQALGQSLAVLRRPPAPPSGGR